MDIFAGPGGLGEGFCGFSTPDRSQPFRITVSAEMDLDAWKTLRLRAFFRQFPTGRAPSSYYDYVAGRRETPFTARTEKQWAAASDEACRLRLGTREDDKELRARISSTTRKDQPWVLVGGPPCQAYSLVGRARNSGIVGYRPEDDERFRLYQHYRKLVAEFRPAAFVMENVKGLLSAKVDGTSVFEEILESLHRPGGRNGPRYRLVPLVQPNSCSDSGLHDPRSFVLRAEDLGVPQARHRVILLGVLEDIWQGERGFLQPGRGHCTVGDVIGFLPRLRSGTTDRPVENWPRLATEILRTAAAKASTDRRVATLLKRLANNASGLKDPGSGGRHMPRRAGCDKVPAHLESWLLDPKMDVLLNHEVREHKSEDLQRYAYVSAFGEVYGRSPRGSAEFPIDLHPEHKNWKSGKFVDRFKVQLRDRPSLTITSHLQKDGHYFIHPDPSQMRSLSVREAARIQTFPDNYYFEGGRGAQYRQVGNAVPPWLACQIAGVVHSYLSG